jgi:hypothetical protein
MQTLKRKWQNFKTYRQLHEQWAGLKGTGTADNLTPCFTPSRLESLSKFLESFKNAGVQLEATSDRKGQIDQIFGDCGEVLSFLLTHLKHFLINPDALGTQQAISMFLNPILEVLELLERSEKYRKTLETSQDLANIILIILDSPENLDTLLITLKLISAFTVEGKKEICKIGGGQKLLQLLLNKNDVIAVEVAKTVKLFIKSPVEETASNGGFRHKLNRVIGGVTKLAWSFFPSEDSSRSVEKLSEETEEQPVFPPPESALRSAHNSLLSKLRNIEEIDQTVSPGSSPNREETKHEIVIDEILYLPGAVTLIAKALLQAPNEIKLDLLDMLRLLLIKNQNNQKEFRKVDGYMFLYDYFNNIPTDTTHNLKILETSFKILITTALNGKNSNQINNMNAFKLILHLGANSPNAWIVKGAIESLQNLLNINWENALSFYDQGLSYLNCILERNCLFNETYIKNPIKYYKENVEIFSLLDETLRYLSFLLGNAWEKNMEIIKIYADVIQKHADVLDIGILSRLVLSMEGIVADINVRCNKRNALVRSTFLGCFEGMKITAVASLLVLERDVGISLPLIANLLQYELLYTETLLSSPLSNDTQNTLFPFSIVSKFKEFFKMNPTGKWVYEKYLVTKCGCDDVELELYDLIKSNELLLAIKILMMEEYPHISKFRAWKARERFLNNGGIEIIKSGLPEVEYFWLMLGTSKCSIELKYKLSTELEFKDLALSMPVSIDSVHILLELATSENYIEYSEYLSKISAALPTMSSDVISQVTQPRYLFNPIPSSNYSSTAASTLQLLDKIQGYDTSFKEISIVSGSYLIALLVFLPRCDPELQSDIIKKLIWLSKSYLNKQVLSTLQYCKLLLEITPKLSRSVQEVSDTLLVSLLSYSTSPEEANILLENLMKPNVQKILSRCLSLDLHSTFYVLENQTLDTPTITNFSKSGYSLMFWFKMPKATADLTPIFSWVDHNRGLVLFKLSIMHAGEKKISGLDYMKASIASEPGSYLLIQTPTQPMFPAPDESMKYPIESSNDWIHISIIHSKTGVVLHLNSVPFPLFKCTNFGNIREKYNVTGVFGSKSRTIMVSSIYYIEGGLESSAVLSNYNKDLPEKYIFKVPEEIPAPITYSLSLDANNWDIKPYTYTQNLHNTYPIKYALGQVSAIPQFLSLLKTSLQPVALGYVCECITQNNTNYKIFLDSGGWNVLGGILAKHEEFTTSDSLEYIVSAIINKGNFHHKLKSMLVVKPENIPFICTDRLEGFSVVSELLAMLPAGSLSGLLDCFAKLFSLEENAKLFLSPEINGLMVLLELINSLVKENYQNLEYALLTIYEKILPYFTQDHLEILFDYLCSPELRQHFIRIEKTVESMISIFSVYLFAGNQQLLDKFMAIEGNLLLFEIARSSSEYIRYAAIRLMGLLLVISSKYKAWFMRSKGFDMLSIILQKQKTNRPIYDLLLLLALNAFNNISLLYPSDPGNVKMIINLSDIAAKVLPNNSNNDKKIVYVEVFEILFEILKLESDENIKLDVSRSIENLLDPENCEKVLDSAFLVWSCGLVKETQHLSIPNIKESKNYYIFDTFIIKICIYDLNRASNKSKLLHWINKIPDADSFREKCLLSLLKKIKSNPDFDSCEGYISNKPNFIKNLYTLLQNCELTINYSEINMKVMHLINLLASCNTPAVRQQMKTIGYFDLRDDLIIQMLKGDLPQHQLIEGIQCFSFETIASQPKFRDSNAIIYFIKFLIEFHSAPNLQMEILNLIKNDICVHEENRKYLRKILENKFFLDFLAGFKADDSNTIAQCFRSMKQMKLDEEGESFPENPTPEDFLNWLNRSEKAKKTILAQVNKHLSSIDLEYKKNYNKALELKALKRKKAVDVLIKDKTTVQKQVNELELKLITRVTKAEEKCTQRFQQHSSFKSQKLSIAVRKSL